MLSSTRSRSSTKDIEALETIDLDHHHHHGKEHSPLINLNVDEADSNGKEKLGARLKSKKIPLKHQLIRASPYVIMTALVFGCYSWLFRIIPLAFAEQWGNFAIGFTVFAEILSVLTITAFYFASWGLHPGRVPDEWVYWAGDKCTQPEIPHYAVVSEEWKRQFSEHKEKQKRNTIEKVIESANNEDRIKTITYTPGMVSKGEKLTIQKGITLISSEDDQLTESNMKWQPLNAGKTELESVKVEQECPREANNESSSVVVNTAAVNNPLMSLKISSTNMEAFANSIQWGSIKDPAIQKQFIGSLMQGASPLVPKAEQSTDAVSIQLNTLPSEQLENLPKDNELGSGMHCQKDKCDNYRPPRTHHCSKCKICVTRMDHHCIWIGNCVGLGNHKSFILFLFYFLVASSLFVLMTMYSFYRFGFAFVLGNGYVRTILLTSFLAAVAALYPVGFLLKVQIDNLMVNRTEMEKLFHHPDMWQKYSKDSVLENIKIIMGRRMISWPIPW